MREAETRSRPFAKALRRKMTHAEVRLWQTLRKNAVNGFHFRRQHPIGPYVADFACAEARIIIEVDGASHDTTDGMRHDEKRTAYLTEAGWRLLRFSNNDIYKNLDGVWAGVNHALHIERGFKREGQ